MDEVAVGTWQSTPKATWLMSPVTALDPETATSVLKTGRGFWKIRGSSP